MKGFKHLALTAPAGNMAILDDDHTSATIQLPACIPHILFEFDLGPVFVIYLTQGHFKHWDEFRAGLVDGLGVHADFQVLVDDVEECFDIYFIPKAVKEMNNTFNRGVAGRRIVRKIVQ